MLRCVREGRGGVLIDLHVVPNSKKEQISYNEWEGRLHIRIREPPMEGKANKRIVELFSDLFGGCRVVSGKLSRKKTVMIKDASMDHVHEKLGDIL